jgi:general secretion pathway protein K
MSWASFKRALRRPVIGTPAPAVSPARRRHARRERGVALIMVVTSIAILTAVSVEFLYSSQVDFQLAVNARDELRAEYLARSGVSTGRLLLRFQKQIDGQSRMMGQVLSSILGGGTQGLGGSTQGLGGLLGSGGQAAPGGGGSFNIRLWDIIPVDCNLFMMLLGASQPSASGAAPELPAFGEEEDFPKSLKGTKTRLESFGDYQGCFHAEIEDEEQKINLNRLNNPGPGGRPPMLQALTLLADSRFDFVFEKSDANGVKMTPQEVLIAIHDWIDDRDTQASLDVTGAGEPFLDGFGDENRNYMSKYQYRYRSKNALFDSLDELYMVDGASDLFMAAFRDRLTVYPDKNRMLNINTNDRLQQILNIMSVAANENDPKLRNFVVIQSILDQIALVKLSMPFVGMSLQTFLSIVESNGIVLRPEIKSAGQNNRWLGDKSETFTIKATGQAGKVERTMTAVVRYNDALGKVLYFREE